MLCSMSTLDTEKLKEIQKLEKELGKPLLAFSCHDIKSALLSEQDLEKIRTLENKLSLSLIAIEQ